MKKTALIFSSVLFSSCAFGALSITSEDLVYYWDFSEVTTSTSNPYYLPLSYLKPGVNTPGHNQNTSAHSVTGGFGGGGYLTSHSDSNNNDFNLYTGVSNTLNSTNMSISMQVRSYGTDGISFSSIFGKNPDETFKLQGTGVSSSTTGSNWTYNQDRIGILDNNEGGDWQSVVISIDHGYVTLFVDGVLFAKTNSAVARVDGSLTKFQIGGTEGGYMPTKAQFSDLAFWSSSLNAEDAAYLSANKAGNILIPETSSATLSLVALAGLLLRRRVA